jgi:hypothetical protein
MISRRAAAYSSMTRRASSKRLSLRGRPFLLGRGLSARFMPDHQDLTKKGPLIQIKELAVRRNARAAFLLIPGAQRSRFMCRRADR